jgi:hypothetical protein
MTQTALAEMCVKIDESKDNLSPAERVAAQSLLEAGFSKAGAEVGDAGCADAYTLINIRLGKSITTIISGPKGDRQMQVERIEELGAAYEQIAYSIVHGTKLGDTASQGVNRNNVTAKQAVPMRVESDSLIHLSFGSGLIVGAPVDGVPINLGGSYRYELDSFGIDIGGSLLIMSDDEKGDAFVQGSLAGLYFFNGEANHSLFAGGGLGLSRTGVEVDDVFYDGGGMHARAVFGYEFLRASTIRFSLQADLTIPFYSLDRENESMTNADTQASNKSLYAPILGISIGGAYTNSANSTRKSIVRVY